MENFINEFVEIYNRESKKLPYHINVIDELHAGENAHSRILNKLLNQKTAEGKLEIFESFILFIQDKYHTFCDIKIKEPIITQEKERIDLWIRDTEGQYAIIIENKVKNASDQETQIHRYIETTIKYDFSAPNIYVLYLPPTYEKEPDMNSWGEYYNKEIYNKRYLKLSFKDDILPWLQEKILPNVRRKDIYLSSSIEQYIDHLEGIFSLRTINNQMNMELQKFIKEKWKLSDNNPRGAISILKEKEMELNNAITQVQEMKSFYISLWVLSILTDWENKLKEDFPDEEVSSPDSLGFGFKINDKSSIYIAYNPQCNVWVCGTTYPDGVWKDKEKKITSIERGYEDFKKYFQDKKSEINNQCASSIPTTPIAS
jgi:hypothetical protein